MTASTPAVVDGLSNGWKVIGLALRVDLRRAPVLRFQLAILCGMTVIEAAAKSVLKCPKCKGTGRFILPLPIGAMSCPACNGTGKAKG